jgi:hypothetical protein
VNETVIKQAPRKLLHLMYPALVERHVSTL